MKKLSLVIAAAAAVLALAGCKNGAQEVAVVESVGFGSDYYYGVTGTIKVTTSTKIGSETYKSTVTYTATDKTLANVKTSSDYNTNKIVYNYTISELKTKTPSDEYLSDFGFVVVKMGDDYYLNLPSYEDDYEYGKFAGNSSYIKLENFSTENLTGTVTYTEEMGGNPVTVTTVLNLELSKL